MTDSSTFPEMQLPRMLRGLLVSITAILLFISSARAIDPDRAFSQYVQSQWTSETGFEGGQVNAFAQTADGYLWLGTEKGLYRFDGVNFVTAQQLGVSPNSLANILGLATDGDGHLWIRTQDQVFHYRNGVFEEDSSSTSPGAVITAMNRGIEGQILLADPAHQLILAAGESFRPLVTSATIQTALVISIAQTSDGKVWMGTRGQGLLCLSKGQLQSVVEGLPDRKINSLLATKDGELWIGTDNGLALWNGKSLKKDLPSPVRHTQIIVLMQDRDDNIWVGTPNGLVRLKPDGAALQELQVDGNGKVTALFEDRERNIWIGSTQGMRRLRDTPFVTYTRSEGLPSEAIGSLYVDAEQRTWFAPTDGGLYWMRNGKVAQELKRELRDDVIYSISGSKGDLWLGRQRGGLTHVSATSQERVLETYTHVNGLAENSVYAVHVARDGTVWAGTLGGGVSKFKNGIFRTYTKADGLASNSIQAIEEGPEGTIWFATREGLSALSRGQWKTYTERDGLPSNDVISVLKDSKGKLWVGTAGGLAVLDSNGIRGMHSFAETLREPVLGMAEDRTGCLWLTSTAHVLKINRDRLLAGSLQAGDIREYTVYDGLHGTRGVRRHKSIALDQRGRVWFSLNRGISVVDPGRRNNTAFAISHIESVSNDGAVTGSQGPVHIAGPSRRLAFTYSGLSLSVPERVRFRYRLDGFDHDWSDATAAREAVYTNLAPGSYRFRVMSSNSDGLWGGRESGLSFTIEPAFWQAWWFRISCLAVLASVLWALYRLRLRQISKQMQMRLEERIEERERIARDLHDTLLQGIFSASLRLEVADDRLPADSEAKPLIQEVLELTRKLGTEGRSTIRILRSSRSNSDGLEEALSQIPQEFSSQKDVQFQVIAEGVSRPLRPLIRDEVYRIGREGIINAFRHSRANRIEVEVEYASRQLRLLVRDDGDGIDEHLLRSGREGHWGLSGMRERAEKIGARFDVLSRLGAGTEIELSVPGKVAFESSSSNWAPTWLLAWLFGKEERERPRTGEE